MISAFSAFRFCAASADHPIFAHLPAEDGDDACCLDVSASLLKFSTVALAVGEGVLCGGGGGAGGAPCTEVGPCVARCAAQPLAFLPIRDAAAPAAPPVLSPPGSPGTPRHARPDDGDDGWIFAAPPGVVAN